MVIAFDYGEKKTGFAYSDETETFAFSGHLIDSYKNLDGLKQKIDLVLEEYSPTTIVFGDPT
jgi:RNase H-fold protein (predicted Holliday junction resolvase)